MPLSDNYKSVFVIGAGASYGYGYPMGSGLTALIDSELIPGNELFQIVQSVIPNPNTIVEFRNRFIHSEVYSIDAFLKRTVVKYPNYQVIGKIIIAVLLTRHENPSRLFEKNVNEFHWMRHFFNLLDDDLKGDWSGLSGDKFYFISFNYDRTLEYYIYVKLKYLYDFTDVQIVEAISKLNITHVHGHLGKLPFADKMGYGYEVSMNQSRAMKSVDSIRFAYETMNNDPQKMTNIHDVRKTIKSAFRLFFLGFSYHPDNMEILNLDGNRSGRNVFGSSFGMSATRMSEIRRDHGTIQSMDGISTIETILNLHPLW